MRKRSRPNPNRKWEQVGRVESFEPMELESEEEEGDDTYWIEGYVRDALERAFKGAQLPSPPGGQHMSTSNASSKTGRSAGGSVEVFDTHHMVIVKVHMNRAMTPDMRAYVNSEHIKLEGFPEDIPSIIKLPSNADFLTGKGSWKNRILQFVFRKVRPDTKYYEIRIKT